MHELQQHLPFTVLKRSIVKSVVSSYRVATAPTVYGIETNICFVWINAHAPELQQHLPFTVLKPFDSDVVWLYEWNNVATAPTVYGIETGRAFFI